MKNRKDIQTTKLNVYINYLDIIRQHVGTKLFQSINGRLN